MISGAPYKYTLQGVLGYGERFVVNRHMPPTYTDEAIQALLVVLLANI